MAGAGLAKAGLAEPASAAGRPPAGGTVAERQRLDRRVCELCGAGARGKPTSLKGDEAGSTVAWQARAIIART